jgi:hypothetical protein
MREGAISSEERSLQFDDIPIDEKEIKQLPKKVSHRPMFELTAS